jgi:hypothetical protein
VPGSFPPPTPARTKPGFFLLTSNREPQCRRPRPLRLCEPDHTVPACPGLHFHLLVTDLDSEGGSSWETAICPPRRRRTRARPHHLAARCESDRGQPAPARGGGCLLINPLSVSARLSQCPLRYESDRVLHCCELTRGATSRHRHLADHLVSAQ